jgi:O-antigen ligase
MSRGLQTATERTVIWQSSMQMIRDYPWFGVGPGNFAEQYQTRYILPQAKERKSQPHAHNNLLSVWSEMGILGLSAFLALFAYVIRHYWRQARRTSDNSRLWAVLLATLGLQLHGLSDYTFLGFPTVIQTYWFLVGVFWKHPYLAEEVD